MNVHPILHHLYLTFYPFYDILISSKEILKGEINMLEIIIGTACLTGFVKSVVWIISVEGGFKK